MRRLVPPLLFATVALGLYVLGAFTGQSLVSRFGSANRTDVSFTARQPTPSGQGYVRPKDDVLKLGGIPGDRIKTLFVSPNKRVQKGDKLVEFFSRDERVHELNLARKNYEQAKAQLEATARLKTIKLTELDLQGVKALSAAELKLQLEEIQLPTLREGAKLTNDLLDGLRSLDPSRASVTAQDLQKAVVEATAANARLNAALITRDTIRAQLKLDQQSLQTTREVFEAESELSKLSVSLPILKDQLDLAQLRYDRSVLVAESDGTILRVTGREGSVIGQEPIIQMTTSDEMVVVTEVADVSRNQLDDWLELGKGVPATIRSRAIRGVMHGIVKSQDDVSPIVARNSLPGFSPRAEIDRRIIEVIVELDKESSKKVAKFVGAEVTVQFHDPTQPIPSD